MKIRNCIKILIFFSVLLIIYPSSAFSQDSKADTALKQSENMTDDSPTKSGYKDTGSMEGPDGVVAELNQDDVDTGAVIRSRPLEGAAQPWFDLKRKWNQKYGLKLGLNYNALYMAANETLTSEDDAAGGRFQIQGMWTALGRKTKNPGGISFRFEDRHRLGTDIAPIKLGAQFGSITIPGTGFSEFDFTITELAWRQTILDGNMKFGLGKIAATSWYNVHALSSALTGFQNNALRSSNSKPSIARGIGALTGFRLGQQFALLAGIHDANAVTGDNPFDTIDEMEFFYSTEIRWFPTTFDRRRWDNLRLNLWYVDETDDGATPSSQGVTFTASRLFKDFYMPFLLGGVSDGDASLARADITAGIGFAFNTRNRAARDVLGIGLNWSDPSNSDLRDQYSTELFYRVQLLKNFQFTPSAQYILDPSANPEDDQVWLIGFRGRLTF